MSIILLENTDRWLTGNKAASAVLSAYRKFMTLETRALLLCQRDPKVLILGPHRLSKPLTSHCYRFREYSFEDGRTDWPAVRDKATRLYEQIAQPFEGHWIHEGEKQAWKAIRPWVIHKLMHRHVAPEVTLARLRVEINAVEPDSVPIYELPISGKLYSYLDRFGENREREIYWRMQRRHAGAGLGLHAKAPDVLLISTSLYSPRVLIPLAQALLKEGLSHHILAVDSKRPWPYDQAVPPEVSWSYLFSHTNANKLDLFMEKCRRRALDVVRATDKVEGGKLQDDLRILLMHDWVQAQCFEMALSQFLDQYPTKFIVCPKQLRVLEGASVEVAHKRRLPVLFIDSSFAPASLDHIAIDPQDHIAVSSPQMVAPFTNFGAQKEHIHLVGDIRLDPVLKHPADATASNGGTFKILAIGELPTEMVSEEELRVYYQSLVKVQQAFPEVQLLLKLHPKQTLSIFRREVKAWGLESLPWIQSKDLYELMRGSSLIISHLSIAVMEAMFLEKPVLVFLEAAEPEKLLALTNTYPYLNSQYAQQIFSGNDLIQYVKAFRQDPESRRLLIERSVRFKRDHLFDSGGESSTLTAKLISSLIERKVEYSP